MRSGGVPLALALALLVVGLAASLAYRRPDGPAAPLGPSHELVERAGAELELGGHWRQVWPLDAAGQ